MESTSPTSLSVSDTGNSNCGAGPAARPATSSRPVERAALWPTTLTARGSPGARPEPSLSHRHFPFSCSRRAPPHPRRPRPRRRPPPPRQAPDKGTAGPRQWPSAPGTSSATSAQSCPMSTPLQQTSSTPSTSWATSLLVRVPRRRRRQRAVQPRGPSRRLPARRGYDGCHPAQVLPLVGRQVRHGARRAVLVQPAKGCEPELVGLRGRAVPRQRQIVQSARSDSLRDRVQGQLLDQLASS